MRTKSAFELATLAQINREVYAQLRARAEKFRRLMNEAEVQASEALEQAQRYEELSRQAEKQSA